MAHLPSEPTLRELQNYLAEVCQERGWTKDSPPEKFVLFIEEVGELAKAIRKKSGLYSEAAKQSSFDLEEELPIPQLSARPRQLSRSRSGVRLPRQGARQRVARLALTVRTIPVPRPTLGMRKRRTGTECLCNPCPRTSLHPYCSPLPASSRSRFHHSHKHSPAEHTA